MLSDADRERFDALLEEAIEQLPPRVRELLEEVPVVALDRPTRAMLIELGIDPDEPGAATELCGLHTGTANTEQSVEHPELSSAIHLFREGIIDLAGGFAQPEGDDAVFEEIAVTLLHEIGHQFGLSEEDLDELGYG